MNLTNKINYTRQGGRYYRAIAWLYFTVIVLIIPLVVLLILGLLNPFWFREDYLRWLQNNIEKITARRNYKMYAIYLGMDPKVWHTLTDNKSDS